MKRAIELAKEGIKNGGGPFGAVVVRDNKIIAEAYNEVTLINDPTAHAEVLAIRRACKALDTFDLSNCELYSSCEPCPMCLSAIYWARIKKLHYSAGREQAEAVGFDDAFIYKELDLEPTKRRLKIKKVLIKEAEDVFKLWSKTENKRHY